jgi:hypothetical protein
MAHKKRIELSRNFADYLSNQPEKGMGYQIVDVILKNGDVLVDRIILNSEFLELKPSDEIKLDDINKIVLK